MRVYDTACEPIGDSYADLLRFCWREAHTGSLTVREELGRSPKLDVFINQLSPAIVKQLTVDRWPGTLLLEGSAKLYTFTTNNMTLHLALASTNRLFNWLQPELPEDLAIYRSDGSVLMESISHECAARLFLHHHEYQLLPLSIQDLLTACDQE